MSYILDDKDLESFRKLSIEEQNKINEDLKKECEHLKILNCHLQFLNDNLKFKIESIKLKQELIINNYKVNNCTEDKCLCFC